MRESGRCGSGLELREQRGLLLEQVQGTAEQPDLPDFEPSEKLPADSAVAFPTDI